MAKFDCHGQLLDPCMALMTCPNFKEIILASDGVAFKNPDNPYAGLTIKLRDGSGLIVDADGLGINLDPGSPVSVNGNGALTLDLNTVCLSVEGCLIQKGWGPIPTIPTLQEICEYVKGCLADDGIEPPPEYEPPLPSVGPDDSDSLPLYKCYEETDDEVGQAEGTVTLNFYASTGKIVPSVSMPVLRYYSGTTGPSSATYIGKSSDSNFNQSAFNNITMVTRSVVCESEGGGEPPAPEPGPDTEPKTLSVIESCRGGTPASYNIHYDGTYLIFDDYGPGPLGGYIEWIDLLTSGYGVMKSFKSGSGAGHPTWDLNGQPYGSIWRVLMTPQQYEQLTYMKIYDCYFSGA